MALELSHDLFVREAAAQGESEGISRPSITYWQDAWRRLKQNRIAIAGLIFLVIMTLMVIIAPMVSKYTYDEVKFDLAYASPSADHLFGTDRLGRDVWTRVWHGGRVSILIGVVAALLDLGIGALYGGISGYFGGTVDDMMMRIVEVISGLPGLLVQILLMLVMGAGMWTIIVVMVLLGWVGMARLVRGQVLQLKEQEFVLAARTLGASPLRIILKHLLPNAMGQILVFLTQSIPGAIFFEAILSFLGLGLRPPQASWGILATEGRSAFQMYPHLLVYPCVAIAVTILAVNLFGDGLRDALDPKLRGRD